jgi:hypothetical protein
VQLELELQPKRRHSLLLASSAEAAWQGAAEEWFKQVATEAWKNERPSVVVVPTRGQIQALKGRMLEAGLSALGLEFVTPPYLRALLVRESGSLPPARENLRLLLALAAEQLVAEKISFACSSNSVPRGPNSSKSTCLPFVPWCENFALN